MKSYLPTKSHIAVRSTKAGASAKWYDTKAEVAIPATVKTTTCPMRGTEVVVQTFVHEGFEIYYLPGQVKVRLEAHELRTDLSGVKLYHLDYDVSRFGVEQLRELYGMGHPSEWLWDVAIRISESSWLIPENRINWTYMNRMTEVGATWNLTPYDASATPSLIGQCVQALQRELDGQIARNAEAQQAAQVKLDATPTEDDPEKARKGFLQRAKEIQKRTEALEAKIKAAAGVFGISESVLNFARVVASRDSLRTSMQERARLFSQARDAAKALGTADGNAVAAAMDAGTMPAEIAADFVQENVSESQGEALRAAFNGQPVSEEDTFSLDLQGD